MRSKNLITSNYLIPWAWLSILLSPLALTVTAGPLLTITPNDPAAGWYPVFVYQRSVVGASWAQGVDSYHTDIYAAISGRYTPVAGTAYLMHMPSLLLPLPDEYAPSQFTVQANEIAVADFLGPQCFGYSCNQTLTPLFTNLTLAPGTYYLILSSPEPLTTYGMPNGMWGAVENPPGWSVNAAPGFTALRPITAASGDVAAYPPASLFWDQAEFEVVFQLNGSAQPNPEPATFGIVGLSLATFFGLKMLASRTRKIPSMESGRANHTEL